MPDSLRILFIGETGADAIAAELRRGGYDPAFERATTREELDAALATGCDIAISDFAVGGFGALEALRTIVEKGIDLPLIVVSGEIAEADALAALKAGAADHLRRGALTRLNAAVERELRASQMRRARSRLEEQFRQAQKMEAVGRMAGGVAHDFNNLLTIITGYSELLLTGGELKDSQRAAIEEIRRAAERGGQLTHQLLAFSRRQPLATHKVLVNDLVLRIERMLHRLIGEDIELAVVTAASRDCVEVDAGGLEQVIMNLVVNARDAMPNGGKLTIETATLHLGEAFTAKQLGVQPGVHLAISITDTGVGMDEATLSHLFEPFFTTKEPGRGTGLGLATAYGIIRQSRGAIAMLSELGKGTTARIYLPVADSEPETEAAQRVVAQAGATGAETILLVEDEAHVRKLIAGVLTSRGYRVLEAARGEEAIRLARTHQGFLHLALVDVVMPEMSGPDLIRQIEPLRPGLRVLFISGHAEEAVVNHGLPASCAFLQKPFLPEALAGKVREVLDAGSQTAND
jgi:signal transduction histidine kinase